MNKSLRIKDQLLILDEPKVMGIINVTPDSFYHGSRYTTATSIFEKIEHMLKEGADIIDIGAMSSRPGAQVISAAEEIERLSSIAPHLKKKFPTAIFSIDTFHAETAKYALDHGFDMVNDISGGELDSNMFDLIMQYRVPYVMMHMRGIPATMQQFTQYNHILEDIIKYFAVKIEKFHQHGFSDIIIDPGFGFSKTLEQNYQLLHHLEIFHIFEKPLLVGVSRKSMIFRLLETDPDHALEGTIAVETIALLKGAHILRVHDVKHTKDLIKIVHTYQQSSLNP